MSLQVLFEIAEGWTAPLNAQVLLRGAAFDSAGYTVTAIMRDHDGLEAPIAVAWSATLASTSVVTLTPIATTFKAALAPYTIHFKVVDGAGAVVFFPPGDPAQITVAAV
jgi:hypothetical protein